MSRFTYSMPCGGKAVVTTVRNASDEQWVHGSVDLTDANGNGLASFNYIAMVFDEPSEYGIRNGRVSKLQLNPAGSWTGIDSAVANYDRGWDVVPDPMSNASFAVEAILRHYSNEGSAEPDDAQRTFTVQNSAIQNQKPSPRTTA